MDASPLGRSSPTEGNISRSPFIDCHDAAWDAHTSALFSERCQLYGEEWRGRRAASDTFPPLRDMVSSLPRIWHSSESLPPLPLLATLRHDMQVNTGVSFLHNMDQCGIQSVVKILEMAHKIAKIIDPLLNGPIIHCGFAQLSPQLRLQIYSFISKMT